MRLVQRTTRSLNMTDAGRLYYEQSSQALRTIEDANLRLAEARAEPSGTIRIRLRQAFGGHFLTGEVFDFLAAYPKTKVELHLLWADRAFGVGEVERDPVVEFHHVEILKRVGAGRTQHLGQEPSGTSSGPGRPDDGVVELSRSQPKHHHSAGMGDAERGSPEATRLIPLER